MPHRRPRATVVRPIVRVGVRVGVLAGVVAVAALGACASQGMPPGGPPDTAPPQLLRVTPESGTVSVTPRSVEFRFDEVVSERPRAAQSLEQLVVISPTDGPPDVSWGRDRLIIRPRHGWRPNTAYTVTVLPGLTDLRSNASPKPFRTVFATGTSIPSGAVRGVAFDWMAGQIARGARIEATIGTDTILRYGTAADSTGRFTIGSLPAATFLVRAWVDANSNGVRDPREPWDTATIILSDSARHDLYVFPHDTIGARFAEVAVADSTTIRVRFDHGLRTPNPVQLSQFRLIRASDSTEIPLRRVAAKAAFDSITARERVAHDDSVASADTSEAGRHALALADSNRIKRQRDSSAQAQIATLKAARDTTRRDTLPKLARPVPPTEFVIVTAQPMPVAVPLRLIATDIQAIEGPPRTSDRSLARPKPLPRDTTATKRPPAPRDTTGPPRMRRP